MITTESQAEFNARMTQGYAERDARWAASQAAVVIPAPREGEWIVRSDIDDTVKARGFVSYDEAREFCAGWDDVYACQYRSAAWDEAFNVLCDRAEKAERSADALDEAFSHTNLSLATDAIGEVGDAYPDVCEDDPITRFACYVVALEEAVAQAAADYPEVGPCMSFGSSGWSREAFPMAALGL